MERSVLMRKINRMMEQADDRTLHRIYVILVRLIQYQTERRERDAK